MKIIAIKQGKSNAWTLTELLFVLAIIGILAMIAISLYPGYVERAETASSQYVNHKAITDQKLRDAGVD